MNFRIPTFRLPDIVARIGQRLPQWPHGVHLVLWLNAACALRLLPEDTLAALEGKTFRVDVRDTGGSALFACRNGRFRPVFDTAATVDLAFAGNLSAYLQLLARQEDPDTLFFSRELEITGDTELGLLIKNTLDAIELPQFSLPFRSPFAGH